MAIDLELPSEDHQKDFESSRSDFSRTTQNRGGKSINGDGSTTSSQLPSESDKEYSGQTLGGCTSSSKYGALSGGPIDVNLSKDLEPHGGMEFNSKEDAFTFYKEYAKSVGFATITKASRRSRISGKFIDAKFVCTRYGKKRESSTTENPESVFITDGTENIPVKRKRGRMNQSWSKTDCAACMHVKRRQDGRWCISSFIKEHNHEIYTDQAYYYSGHRNIDLGSNAVGSSHATREKTKKIYLSMSRKSGKVKNKKNEILNGSRQYLALEDGDAQIMVDHFLNMQDENPNFFFAIDLNPGQQLRNVFWVSAKGRVDYEHFSDVVFIDTTCIKNEYKLSFVPFIGVNHHAQFVLLGCALIAEESKSNFVWGMQAFHRAMGGRTPKVILTDQDKALKEAVAEVFPYSRHCFCLWHILSKIQEKLGYVTRRNEHFIAEFDTCVLKSVQEEDFEKRWWEMVDRSSLRNDSWIQSLYEDRKQWVPTYMTDVFLAGFSTRQRSESINTFFDKFIQRKLIAKAHYKAGSKKTQDIAREFFDAMDKDNSRKVDYVEFKEFMKSKGHSYYVDKNLFNNLGRHGLLDFWDVMTLYYIIKSRRPFCSKCDELVASVYFACVKCFERSRRPYCICLPCYGHADYDFKHRGCDHPSFLDSYTLLEAQRLSAYE